MQKKTLFMLFFFSLISYAQPPIPINNQIQDIEPSKIESLGTPIIKATHYRLVKLDSIRLQQQLIGANCLDSSTAGKDIIINLPLPDGTFHKYHVVENNTMARALSAKFPQIKAYNGYGVDNSQEYVKFDVTPLGVHAMILSPGKPSVFIDPAFKGNRDYYMVYKQSDFRASEKMICETSAAPSMFDYYSMFTNYQNCLLRKYKLAVAASPDYTDFFGGVTNALAAQVVSINRINGIYESEFGATLELIANNENIIFTYPYPSGVEPYTVNDNEKMIEENQYNIDYVIGTGNYDIGHVFSTGSGGLAVVAGVCNSAWKAKAVSASPTPLGPGFDVQFVAHELGHQFGATHVQNNAFNRWDATAVEPGSGSTIMSYAGVSWPNVQNHSDSYFNGINLQQIGYAFSNLNTDSCASKTTIPALEVPTVENVANIVIPASTPYTLIGKASGVNSAGFTYNWEQENNEISMQPPLPTAIGGPNFRSVPPSHVPFRFFPNLRSLVNKGPYTWEVLSSVSRSMNFRFTVRANRPGGSCNVYTDMAVTVDGSSGPFELIYPSVSNIQWKGTTNAVIKWKVANTNKAPISENKVDILLSTNGGGTFSILLATGVANNGLYKVRVPTINTNQARIMVRAASGNFFTISQNNFRIAA
jgi:hypothetical protein